MGGKKYYYNEPITSQTITPRTSGCSISRPFGVAGCRLIWIGRVRRKQQIMRLQVAVYDALSVEVAKGFEQLLGHPLGLYLCQAPVSNKPHQIASGAHLVPQKY